MRHRLSFCPLLAPPRQGEFLGQTKKKVDDLMASAPGGMVFIDEAYNLGGRSLYAKEAVDQLTFCMTDKPYKGKSVVVLARTRPARPARAPLVASPLSMVTSPGSWSIGPVAPSA